MPKTMYTVNLTLFAPPEGKLYGPPTGLLLPSDISPDSLRTHLGLCLEMSPAVGPDGFGDAQWDPRWPEDIRAIVGASYIGNRIPGMTEHPYPTLTVRLWNGWVVRLEPKPETPPKVRGSFAETFREAETAWVR